MSHLDCEHCAELSWNYWVSRAAEHIQTDEHILSRATAEWTEGGNTTETNATGAAPLPSSPTQPLLRLTTTLQFTIDRRSVLRLSQFLAAKVCIATQFLLLFTTEKQTQLVYMSNLVEHKAKNVESNFHEIF